jgi:hypothetical protein
MFIKAPLIPYSTLVIESRCYVQICTAGTIEGIYRRMYMGGYIEDVIANLYRALFTVFYIK